MASTMAPMLGTLARSATAQTLNSHLCAPPVLAVTVALPAREELLLLSLHCGLRSWGLERPALQDQGSLISDAAARMAQGLWG